MPLCAPVPVRLFVHVSMHVCLRVYICVSIAEIAASMRELHMIIEMSVMALGVFDFGAGSCVCHVVMSCMTVCLCVFVINWGQAS